RRGGYPPGTTPPPDGRGPQAPPRSGPGRGRTPSIVLPGGIQIPLPGTRFELLPQFGAPQRGGGQPPRGPRGSVDGADMTVLNSLASASGAKAFLVSATTATSDSIDDVLDQIALELRSQYTIGYYPEHPVEDGKFHQVTVRAKNDRYDVRARKEYF